MDENLDELRHLRGELVARSERLGRWSRLAGARMDLLTAQVCPPSTADEVVQDDLAELAELVLGPGPAAGAAGADGVGRLLALRDARRDLARRREQLDDLLCWSTAQLVLEGSARAGSGAWAARAGVPGQRSARGRTSPLDVSGGPDALGAGVRPGVEALRGPGSRAGAVVAVPAPPSDPACHTPG